MRSELRLLALMGAIVLLGSACHSATITGTVKGVDGAPSQGAFVEAQNAKTKITVIVLSDSQGHYRVENLASGKSEGPDFYELLDLPWISNTHGLGDARRRWVERPG